MPLISFMTVSEAVLSILANANPKRRAKKMIPSMLPCEAASKMLTGMSLSRTWPIASICVGGTVAITGAARVSVAAAT